MKVLLSALTVCIIFLAHSLESKADDFWLPLFDGKTLAGWHSPFDQGNASVIDGEIVLTGDRKFFLVSDQTYKDFELKVDVFVPTGGNSGIQFRSHYRPNRLWGYQAEVDTSDRKWAGGLYEEGRRGWLVPLKDKPEAQAAFQNNQWNTYLIKAIGDRIEISVNGITTVKTRDAVTSEGFIALQHHGEKGLSYRFRNIRIREVSACQPLSLITFGSCCKQGRPQPIWNAITAKQSDLFLMLGDNIYGDSDEVDVLREKYALLGAEPGFQQLRKQTKVLATWDDHDYGLNDGGVEFVSKVGSQKAFNDFFEVPEGAGSRLHEGVYDAHVFGPVGKRTQIILLDTRFHRSPLKKWQGEKRPLTGPYIEDSGPNTTMLGSQQWTWLEEQMKVPAELRILCSSIQFLSAEHGWEYWQNMPLERQRLIDLIQQSGGRSIVLSGDRHLAEISKVSIGERGNTMDLYDITSSSLNAPSGGGNAGEANRYRSVPDHYPAVNFGSVNINWRSRNPHISLSIHDVDGQVVLNNKLRLHDIYWSK